MSREKGMSNKEIAEKLSISEKGVERNIYLALKFLKKNLPLFIIFMGIQLQQNPTQEWLMNKIEENKSILPITIGKYYIGYSDSSENQFYLHTLKLEL